MRPDPIIMSTGSVIDPKALTKAAEKLAEAVKQARYAYEFCPSAYTCTALQACLAAARAFDRHAYRQDDLAVIAAVVAAIDLDQRSARVWRERHVGRTVQLIAK
jgi:hypothetical protein